MDYEISYIMKIISYNYAYLVQENNKTYVYAKYNHFRPRHKPILNEYLENLDYLKDPYDFIIWYPNEQEHSVNTPWGTGIPSANLYVCCIYNKT